MTQKFVAAALAAAIMGSGAVSGARAQLAASNPGTALPKYTAADVNFMQGMIGHHAQAIIMGNWAPTHGASDAVKVLCARIVVSQRDEIASMQRWLRDRHEMVPDANGRMSMDMGPGNLMPGMLTPEQMTELDHAQGPDFDRLFLGYMIRHHQGALEMVHTLFSSEGAAQDEVVFKFASDVGADQTAEINRMLLMLQSTMQEH